MIDKELIRTAKEKLGDDMARIIAEEMGVTEWDERNLKMCCPFHEEDHASFIWNRKTLCYHCFGACGRNYDIIDVLMYKGATYVDAVKRLFELANITYAFGEHRVQTSRNYRYPKHEDRADKQAVYDYLLKRKISQRTADYLDIGQDDRGNCVFHYYDENDVLTTVKYRPAKKLEHGESKNFCQQGADTTPLLYNMNRINTSQPLLITSGELDCAAAIEAGWQNAVSIPFGDGNTHWVERCFDWLEQFDEIIVCPDNDQSGAKYCKEVIPRLGSWRCKVAVVHKNCKDINEMLYYFGKAAVLDMILNAADTPVPSLVDFSDVEESDLLDLDGVYTGFEPLDKDLYKLFYGSFQIVSGAPGSGKTSLIYGLVANALDQNVNCWVFSRELPDWMSKSWFNHIFAGRRNCEEHKKQNGSVYYTVTSEAKKKINDWYKGRLYFYRDDWSNDVESIRESMVAAARKYANRLFIIDNLMTVQLGGNESDKYERQTDFVNWLIQFATKYQVCVILCVHPNKTQELTQAVGMYAISGTSNIINLAHRGIGLRRITKKEKEGYVEGKVVHPPINCDVVVNIIKDRFTGRAGTEYSFYYDTVARRFYSNNSEFDHQYLWDKRTYSTPLTSEKLENISEVFGEITT